MCSGPILGHIEVKCRNPGSYISLQCVLEWTSQLECFIPPYQILKTLYTNMYCALRVKAGKNGANMYNVHEL